MTEMTKADAEQKDRDAERRRVILDAARACFLQFGYAKTSLEDIAQRARISRPLIYRAFKNKDEILGAVYDDFFESQYPAARAAVDSRGSRRERLLRLYEGYAIETWDTMLSSPMARELYEACALVSPEIQVKHDRRFLDLTTEILGSREVAEVFMLALEGLYLRQPTIPVLRKRLAILVEQFTT